ARAGNGSALLKAHDSPLSPALLLANRRSTPMDYFLRSAQAVAPSLGIEVVPSPIESGADYERVIDTFARVPSGGLVFLPDGTSILNRDRIIALAARYRLPAVYAYRFFVAAGRGHVPGA